MQSCNYFCVFDCALLLTVNASQEDTFDWLLTDQASSWPGTPVDRGWRYLRQSLQRHDNADTDYKYTKAALETMLSADRSSPPPWVTQILQVRYDLWA